MIVRSTKPVITTLTPRTVNLHATAPHTTNRSSSPTSPIRTTPAAWTHPPDNWETRVTNAAWLSEWSWFTTKPPNNSSEHTTNRTRVFIHEAPVRNYTVSTPGWRTIVRNYTWEALSTTNASSPRSTTTRSTRSPWRYVRSTASPDYSYTSAAPWGNSSSNRRNSTNDTGTGINNWVT